MLSGSRLVDAEINKTKLLVPAIIWLARLADKMTLSCPLGTDVLCLATNPLLNRREGKMAGYWRLSFLRVSLLCVYGPRRSRVS